MYFSLGYFFHCEPGFLAREGNLSSPEAATRNKLETESSSWGGGIVALSLYSVAQPNKKLLHMHIYLLCSMGLKKG